MNIENAKKEIRRTLRAYRKTWPDGSLKIPVEKQRPLLMIGPPGIGKTAIMKQIAEETGEGLVSYSMTHHTRQSAIGLPIIEKKVYDGREQPVTEYTMSEIVSSLYDYIEKTGKKQGIMFLDEINCVSETLTPVMLQLLQNKTFGKHSLPDGWIIVAAGNPPEYNRAVRELDMATVDRVKNLDIDPDLEIWQIYAAKRQIHPAIRTYLTVYPDHFYVIREIDRQQTFVTARGWEDLSLMMDSCEEDSEEIGEEMIREYLRDPQVAHDFFGFYELFHDYFAAWAERSRETADFRELLMVQGESLRTLPEVACLALSGMLFRQLQEEAHGIVCARRIRERMKAILGREMFLRREQLLTEKARTDFFDRERDDIAHKTAIGRYKPAEAAVEKTALQSLEEELRHWLRTGTEQDFRTAELKQLQDSEAAEAALLGAFREHCEQVREILRGCDHAVTALRYLEADLERDPDTAELTEQKEKEQ